eukprot:1138156-Pelagomonas_calceolata.AAC.1
MVRGTPIKVAGLLAVWHSPARRFLGSGAQVEKGFTKWSAELYLPCHARHGMPELGARTSIQKLPWRMRPSCAELLR